MYFSRVRIKPEAYMNYKILKVFQGNMYSIHQLIWQLFSNQPATKRDFLFRQEYEYEQLETPGGPKGIPIFYVVSERKPLSFTDELIVDVKDYNPQITRGMELDFKVRVNPVIARLISGKNHSSKHDVLMETKRLAKQQGITDKSIIRTMMNDAAIKWFIKKGEEFGYNIKNKNPIEVSSYLQHRIRKKNAQIQFSAVDLSGTLEVIEPTSFFELLSKGIGHSRSFGCGMMMIKRR